MILKEIIVMKKICLAVKVNNTRLILFHIVIIVHHVLTPMSIDMIDNYISRNCAVIKIRLNLPW